jgi:hypothetical protein
MRKIYLIILSTMISFTNAMNNETPFSNQYTNLEFASAAPAASFAPRTASAARAILYQVYSNFYSSEYLEQFTEKECEEIAALQKIIEESGFFEKQLDSITISLELQQSINELNENEQKIEEEKKEMSQEHIKEKEKYRSYE